MIYILWQELLFLLHLKDLGVSFTRKDNGLFCLYLYTFHFLRLKQKMDLLLFLIKKHNNNKTVCYNDKLAYIY